MRGAVYACLLDSRGSGNDRRVVECFLHISLDSHEEGMSGLFPQWRKRSLPKTVLWAEMAPSGQASWQQ